MATPHGPSNLSASQPTHGSPAPGDDRYTVDQLARMVGMSPRNIRAHQARGLLAPPARRGRVAWYDTSHLRRLKAIMGLQRQGFNLVAIAAILGVRRPDPHSEAVTALLQRIATAHPALLQTLSRHGIVARGEDSVVRAVRPRAMRAALELNRAGVQAVASMQVLAEVLDAVFGVATDLVNATSARVLSLTPDAAPGEGHDGAPGGGHGEAPGEGHDRAPGEGHEPGALTQSLTGLLTEAFRVAVENIGRTAVADQTARLVESTQGG